LNSSWIPEAFETAVEAHRSRVALVEEDRKWTFGELAADVDSIARILREKVPGDTVGILLLNSERYVATILAVWKAGKTAVPLNYLLPPQELAFIIRDSGMSAIVSSQFFAQALAAVKPLFGDKGVILMADSPEFTQSSGGNATKYEYRIRLFTCTRQERQDGRRGSSSLIATCFTMSTRAQRPGSSMRVTPFCACCRSFIPTQSPGRYFCRC